MFGSKAKSIKFIAKHPVLSQFADDLSAAINPTLIVEQQTKIFVGIHKGLGIVNWFIPSLKIGIQTEQLCAEDGSLLWGAKKRKAVRNIKLACLLCDVILDLSPSNREFYRSIGLLEKYPRKFVFGPHVFPDTPSIFTASNNERFVFFGAINGTRREKIISNLPAEIVSVVPAGTYGEELSSIINGCQGVLNIHYSEGVYTEVPRLLSAYLHGKVLFSETLAQPFVEGVHYLPIDSLSYERDDGHVFNELSRLVTDEYSFTSFLKRFI